MGTLTFDQPFSMYDVYSGYPGYGGFYGNPWSGSGVELLSFSSTQIVVQGVPSRLVITLTGRGFEIFGSTLVGGTVEGLKFTDNGSVVYKGRSFAGISATKFMNLFADITKPVKLWTYIGELNDKVNGSAGDDVLSGFAGNDAVRGYDGNDTLLGGPGND